MIKFFRKIRYDLMEKKTIGKYLKYAIGEILLVVLGILIALSINNWNEARQMEINMEKSLLALRADLIQDTLLITKRLPFVLEQYQLNESLRARVAHPRATVDTLIRVMRYEFNPNWSVQVPYHTNAYNSLTQSGLIENLSDSLKAAIKNFYNAKVSLADRVEKTTNDYQGKVTSYVSRYTFGSTTIHDQGALIDSLVWRSIDHAHLAATFQGISNFKRILFTETREELEFSLKGSRVLIRQIDHELDRTHN